MPKAKLVTLAILLVGCQGPRPSTPVAAAPPAAAPSLSSGPDLLVVHPAMNHAIHIDAWYVPDGDLRAFVDHRRPIGPVLIKGDEDASYDRALEVEAELRAAGVADVTIAR